MVGKLLDLLISFVHLFQWFFYVDEYEECVVLRMGKYNRTLGPGPHWIIPFAVEATLTVNTKPEPLYLDAQTATTTDGYILTFQTAIVYSVTDVRVYFLEWEDTERIAGIYAGTIMRAAMANHTWKQIESKHFLPNCLKEIRQACRPLGIKVRSLGMLDLASGEANRLWVEGVDLG